MSVIDIRTNADLIKYLSDLEISTTRFFESNERSTAGLPSALIRLHNNLELNEYVCELIGKKFKYFKGVFEGNNHTLYVSSRKVTSLFSSIYHTIVRNLRIYNVIGSKGLLLADDINNSIMQNVKLGGQISLEESCGGFCRTSQNVTFEGCSVDLKTRTPKVDSTAEDINTDPTHFGAYVGVALSGTKFNNCSVSGEVTSEVRVGGFCANAKGVEFNNCTVLDLVVKGARETGLFSGRASNLMLLNNCQIIDSTVTGSIYTGLIVGRINGKVEVNKASIEDGYVINSKASSFVGGIAGSAEEIIVSNSEIKATVTGSFVVAGICPDVANTILNENIIRISVTAKGYPPMMTHAYKLVRTEYTTSNKKEITFIEEDNNTNVKLVELELGGSINPFRESLI